MSRINTIFTDLRSQGRKALMPFLCAGYPRPGLLGESLKAVEQAGASIVEIGIPFSDPIADGPVIAAAMHEALEAGLTPEATFAEVAAARSTVSAGLVAMVSVSIVNRMSQQGLASPEGFIARAQKAGFDGFIFPDAPVEESADLVAAARDHGMTASLLIAPTTAPDRARRIAEASSGFVYLLARAGITGEREDAPDVADRVEMLRQVTDLPIACGFGISTAEHVRAVVDHADAAIVGSALVRRMAPGSGDDPIGQAKAFTESLAAGLR